MEVASVHDPPQRLEGGGFVIRDILSGISPRASDPFLCAALSPFPRLSPSLRGHCPHHS